MKGRDNEDEKIEITRMKIRKKETTIVLCRTFDCKNAKLYQVKCLNDELHSWFCTATLKRRQRRRSDYNSSTYFFEKGELEMIMISF
jgi:transposase-like protein